MGSGKTTSSNIDQPQNYIDPRDSQFPLGATQSPPNGDQHPASGPQRQARSAQGSQQHPSQSSTECAGLKRE